MKKTWIMLLLTFGGTCTCFAQDVHVQVPSDKFPTIQNALDHAPEPPDGYRLYIHIAPGIYHERIYVSQLRPRTTLLGTGSVPSQVVITAALNAKNSQSTFFSETVEILGSDFQADNLTIENTSGPVGQAIALTVNADKAIFKHCRITGFQDTLFANYGRQYYVDSYINGAVDFIFGNASAVFERTEIHAIHPGYLTAQSRTSDSQNTGYVILNSRITDEDLGGKKFTLGRPWRPYSRVVIIHSDISPGLDPKGWSDWGKDPKNVYYAEYENTGEGANMSGRVPWEKKLTAEEAEKFLPKAFLAGEDHWNAQVDAARLP
jgi:pectinesterase